MGTVDKTFKPDNTYFSVVVASALFFALLYKVITPWFSNRNIPGYKDFKISDKVKWGASGNSFLHAILVTLVCGYNFIFDTGLNEDRVWWDSWLVRSTCAFYLGYVIVDTVLISGYYKYIGDIFLIFHHIATIIAFYYIMTFGVFQYYANYRLISEMSTPFINMVWFLQISGHSKSSRVYIVNGLTMTGVFFLCRIAIIPHFWWKVYITFNESDAARLQILLWICIAVCLLLDSINIFWFFKMLRATKKALTKFKR